MEKIQKRMNKIINLKGKKGITLIALVITIIVLLILAGVTVATLAGDNGLLTKAGDSKEKHKISSEIELISLSVQQLYMEENMEDISEERLKSNLEQFIDKSKVSTYFNEDSKVVKIIDGKSRYYKIDENKNVIFIGYYADVDDSSNMTEIGDNVFNLENITKNTYIDASNGKTTNSTGGWDSSDFIIIDEYPSYAIVSDNAQFLSSNNNAVYDENYNFVRSINLTKKTVKNSIIGDVQASINIIKFNNNEKYLRISAENSTLNHIKIFPIKSEQINFKFQYNTINNLIDNYTINDNNLYNKGVVGSSYISNTNGAQIPYDSSWESTDYIDIGDNDKIAICSNNFNAIFNGYNGMYDNNKNFIKTISLSGNTKYNSKIGYYKMIDIPSNVKYLRFSAQTGYLSSLQIFPIETIQEDLSNDFKTSNLIVEDNILNPNNFVKNRYIQTNGNISEYYGWDATDFIELNCKNGIFIKNQSDVYNAIYNESKKFVDIINCSGNDYIYNSKLGKVGIELKYITEDNAKYYRLSNLSEKLRNVKIFPVKNENFNGYVNFSLNE